MGNWPVRQDLSAVDWVVKPVNTNKQTPLRLEMEIRKIAVCFLWLSLPGHYRVTDEALLAETT